MRSIERRFKKLAEKNPTWSSYVCFAESVKKQFFNKQTVHRWFYRLVDRNEWKGNSAKELLLHLDNLTNYTEDDKKTGLN